MHYFYFIDTFVSNKKYQTQLNQIENRLMQLGINGHTERLTMLKSLREMVESAIKHEAKTIIAIGNDDTVSKMMSFLPNHPVTFGVIPVGEPNTIADKLGIPHGLPACDALSARITTKIDLGRVNNSYFISSLALPAGQTVSMDFGTYHISTLTPTSTIHICNINGHASKSDPTDGKLEAVVQESRVPGGWFSKKPKYTTHSVFPLKKVKITSKHHSLPVIADGQLMIKTPVTVEVAPQKLKVIVGKNRMF